MAVEGLGPIAKRKPRDLYCLFIFVAFYAYLIYACATAGDDNTSLDRSYYPLDYYGRFCGKSAEFNKLPFLNNDDDLPSQSSIGLALDTGREPTGDNFYDAIKTSLDQKDRSKLWWPLVLFKDPTTTGDFEFSIHEAVCVSKCPTLHEDIKALGDEWWSASDFSTVVNANKSKINMVCHRDVNDLISGSGVVLPTSGLTTLDVVENLTTEMATHMSGSWNHELFPDGSSSDAAIKLMEEEGFGTSGSTDTDIAKSVAKNLCDFVIYDSTDYEIPGVKERCLPVGGMNSFNSDLASTLDGVLGAATSVTTALRSMAGYLIGSVILCIILGFVWVLLLRMFAKVMTWVLLIGLLVVVLYYGYKFYDKGVVRLDGCKAMNCNDSFEDAGKYYKWVGSGLLILGVVYALLLLYMRKRVELAIEVTKEAGRALTNMKLLAIVPIPFIFVNAIVIGAMTVVVYILWASGSFDQLRGHREFNHEGADMWKFLLAILGLLWGYQLVSAIMCCIIAGAVAHWFWREDKSEPVRRAIRSSLKRTFLYHLGSLALGSFLIAVVQWIRVLLRYFQKKSKALKENATAKFILNCVDCCLKYCEKILKYVNRNAYIYIAIYGKGYFTSAGRVFSLMLRNIVRLFALNTVGDFILWVGKVFTGAINAGIMFWVAELVFDDAKISDSIPVVAAVCGGIIGYACGDSFMDLYEICVDTIMLSFLVCEEEGATEYMSSSLKKLMSRSGKKKAAKREGEKQELTVEEGSDNAGDSDKGSGNAGGLTLEVF